MVGSGNDVAGSSRRLVIAGATGLAAAVLTPFGAAKGAETASAPPAMAGNGTHTATVTDGNRLFVKDWGHGRPVVFSHGWPLTADAWDSRMMFLANRAFRVVARDRRGHGRSDQPWTGNDMDQYADGLAAVIEALDLKDAALVGRSPGGGEVARYTGRHGTARVAQAVLIGAVPPIVLRTAGNPGGLPMSVFDGIRAGVQNDRSQVYRELAVPFYGFNRPNAKVSQGAIDSFRRQGMLGSIKGRYDCIKEVSEVDHTDDLRRIDEATLVLHGGDDQIAPIADSGELSAKIVKGAGLKVIEGGAHGMCTTQADTVNAALLGFLNGRGGPRHRAGRCFPGVAGRPCRA